MLSQPSETQFASLPVEEWSGPVPRGLCVYACSAQSIVIPHTLPSSQARDFSGYTKESHRAWYLKSRDQLTSLSTSKNSCVSLHFA